MKEYEFPQYYRGIRLKSIVVCKTIGDAAKLWNTTPYQIKTYGYINKGPRTQMAIDNPYLRIVKFDNSGEARYFLPKSAFEKCMKWIDAQNIIDKHREGCVTYNETVKQYPNGKYPN